MHTKIIYVYIREVAISTGNSEIRRILYLNQRLTLPPYSGENVWSLGDFGPIMFKYAKRTGPKNMRKTFRLPDGTASPFPGTRLKAIQLSMQCYVTQEKCPTCKRSRTRNAITDECVVCALYQIELVRHFSGVEDDMIEYSPCSTVPLEIKPTKQAAEARRLIRNEGYTLHADPCRKHHHIRITNDEHPHCYFCDMMGHPKTEANAKGHQHYVSIGKCNKCLKPTLKDVNTDECLHCGHANVKMRQDQVSATMMRDNPDMIISEDEAKEYGLKVYRTGKPCRRGHTGWRYTSTRNCIECAKDRYR